MCVLSRLGCVVSYGHLKFDAVLQCSLGGFLHLGSGYVVVHQNVCKLFRFIFF
jgi:hypothetical protein